MRQLAILPAAIAVAFAAGAAAAHPRPLASVPASDAVLVSPPAEIRITFSEGLVPAFSGIALTDSAGHAAPLGASVVDAKHKTTLAAPIRTKLGPGAYTVSWHVVGDDTHHVVGHYGFQVK